VLNWKLREFEFYFAHISIMLLTSERKYAEGRPRCLSEYEGFEVVCILIESSELGKISREVRKLNSMKLCFALMFWHLSMKFEVSDMI
jgi:hypothetical protein